jgi:UDP-N-acetylglucosamine acyltransferase
MQKIDKSSIIEDGAIIGDNVTIGPFCHISSGVKIGDGTTLSSHILLTGDTTIGENNRIFSHAVIGSIPQDLKFNNEDVKLIIGDNNTIREFTLINPGTEGGGGVTKIGNNNLIMGYVHIGHDVIMGNNCIFANATALGGHVIIEDNVVIGAMGAVHQFVKIGEFAMLAGASALTQDIPPFCMAEGNRAVLRGLNINGLRRHMDRSEINLIKKAYKNLFETNKSLKENASSILDINSSKQVEKMCNFILETKRGIPYRRNNLDAKKV